MPDGVEHDYVGDSTMNGVMYCFWMNPDSIYLIRMVVQGFIAGKIAWSIVVKKIHNLHSKNIVSIPCSGQGTVNKNQISPST
jgi:hypothetical protein